MRLLKEAGLHSKLLVQLLRAAAPAHLAHTADLRKLTLAVGCPAALRLAPGPAHLACLPALLTDASALPLPSLVGRSLLACWWRVVATESDAD